MFCKFANDESRVKIIETIIKLSENRFYAKLAQEMDILEKWSVGNFDYSIRIITSSVCAVEGESVGKFISSTLTKMRESTPLILTLISKIIGSKGDLNTRYATVYDLMLMRFLT